MLLLCYRRGKGLSENKLADLGGLDARSQYFEKNLPPAYFRTSTKCSAYYPKFCAC